MPLELEDYGPFATGPSIIDLEDIIYVSKVEKYVRPYDHVRMWYIVYQMYGDIENREIECEEKRKIWHFFVLKPKPAGRIYQLQEILAHHVKINRRNYGYTPLAGA
jgi:hypothetical protein